MSQILTRALTSSRPLLLQPCQSPVALLSRSPLLPTTHARFLTAPASSQATPKDKGRAFVPGQATLKGKGKTQKYIAPDLKRPTKREPTPPPTKSPEELAKGPYLVSRTPSASLPVYRKWSAGDTKLEIQVRKISGNKQRLKHDMIRDLQLKEEDVKLSPVSGNIEVKGEHYGKIKGWLIDQGF